MNMAVQPPRSRTDHRKRIALVVPSSNTVMENDIHRGLPAALYTIHTDRMYLVETTREAEIRMIEDHAPAAASDLGTLNPDLIVFGCTSAGSLFGLDYDAAICRKLGELAGCPPLGVITSVSEAFARRQPKRVAIITPYIEDLTCSVAKALESEQHEIVAAHGMGIDVNVALADPTPDEIISFARERLADLSFDLLFVSCTNFRSLEAKPGLEASFGVPVVTSNSAVIEAIRRRCETQAPAEATSFC
jgi:maleate isomerase